MLRLSGWTIGYVVTNQLALLFVLLLAKTGEAGDVSAYIYSYAFYQVPHGLLAVSIMTTMTPELARRVTANDNAGFRRDFALGLRYLVLLILPASALFVVLAQPMVGILAFGNFSAHDAAVTADVLQAFAVSLVPFSIYLYALRAFYAHQNTRTPFFLNLFENGANVVLAVLLFAPLGVQGLALAWSGAYAIAAVATLVVLVRRHGSLRDAGLGAATARAAAATLVLALVAAPIAGAIGLASPARALVATVTATAAGLLAYFGILFALRSDDATSLFAMLRQRRGASADV
jgi:putative peptidoglycan lipid II flippase